MVGNCLHFFAGDSKTIMAVDKVLLKNYNERSCNKMLEVFSVAPHEVWTQDRKIIAVLVTNECLTNTLSKLLLTRGLGIKDISSWSQITFKRFISCHLLISGTWNGKEKHQSREITAISCQNRTAAWLTPVAHWFLKAQAQIWKLLSFWITRLALFRVYRDSCPPPCSDRLHIIIINPNRNPNSVTTILLSHAEYTLWTAISVYSVWCQPGVHAHPAPYCLLHHVAMWRNRLLLARAHCVSRSSSVSHEDVHRIPWRLPLKHLFVLRSHQVVRWHHKARAKSCVTNQIGGSSPSGYCSSIGGTEKTTGHSHLHQASQWLFSSLSL